MKETQRRKDIQRHKTRHTDAEKLIEQSAYVSPEVKLCFFEVVAFQVCFFEFI